MTPLPTTAPASSPSPQPSWSNPLPPVSHSSPLSPSSIFLPLIPSVGLHLLTLIGFHIRLCWKLFLQLVHFLNAGTRTWIWVLFRLILFTLILIPGWYRMLRYYVFTATILKNISYGKGFKYRNLLDVYLPLTKSGKAPVIVFVSGGAWIIGYKLWSCLVARAMTFLGYLVIVPDYRNFPQGSMREMKHDIRNAILWAYDHCEEYGGDKMKLIVAGQSAGAQICCCLLLEDYIMESSSSPIYSKPRRIDENIVKVFVGISGPYDLQAQTDHLHSRGLDSSLVRWVCQNEISKHSPYLIAKNSHQSLRNFPKVVLLHGSCDSTIPCTESLNMAAMLRHKGLEHVVTRIYPGWSHTDAILEGPMGGDFRGVRDLHNIIEWFLNDNSGCSEFIEEPLDEKCFRIEKDDLDDKENGFVPVFMTRIARAFNPF